MLIFIVRNNFASHILKFRYFIASEKNVGGKAFTHLVAISLRTTTSPPIEKDDEDESEV